MGPVGLSAVQVARVAGADPVLAIDTVAERLRLAETFGAVAVHLTEEQPREVAKRLTGGRGVDAAIDAVGHPDALDLALRLVRKTGTVVVLGVYAEPAQVHMGLVWLKALTLRAGPANVIAHFDRVLEMLESGALDPRPLVTHHMPLDEAADAYALYDRREALKIALRP
jgi:2-desacetyl-2-hydroxyethyl bacteriochlorophyllide A dehydrogenase